MGPKPKTRSYVHGGYRHRYRIDGYEGRRGGPLGSYRVEATHPHGFSSVEVAEQVRCALACEGFGAGEMPVVATGYGRVAMPVGSCPDARFAGALGAAIIAAEVNGEA